MPDRANPQPLGPEPLPPPAAATPAWRRRAIVALLAGDVFLLTLLLALQLLKHFPAAVVIPWTILALATLAASLACAGCLLHLLRAWVWPLRQLQQLLREVRAGQAPIEELSTIRGPLASLVLQIQHLLAEARQHRAELAHVQREIGQRVAQRTNALERLISSLRTQANRDALTGLYNRRMLDQHLGTVVEQTQAAGGDLCLVMLDLDNFKLLNDTLGHGAGDEFLRCVGQLIRSTIRDQDLAFRCGGDEFVLLLPEAGRKAAESVARRIVSLTDSLGKTYKLSRPVGLSAGITVLSELTHPSRKALLAEADRQLYASKEARKRPGSAANRGGAAEPQGVVVLVAQRV